MTIKTSALVLTLVLAAPVLPAAAQTPAPPTPPPTGQAAPAPRPAPQVDPLTQDAIRKVESGDVAGAIRDLEAQRAAQKASPQGISLLGTLYLRQNQPQEALAVLKPLADAPKADPAVLYHASRAALALKQNDVAVAYLQRGAEAAPDSPAARDLGILVMRMGRLVEAYQLLYPWAAAHPADTEARLAAASLAVQLERAEEAEDFLSAPGIPKDDPAVQMLRGRVLVQKGDGAGAIALLEPLAQKPRPEMDLEIRRALGEAYLVANRPADAVQLLQGRAGSHPGLALLLGRAQRKAGDTAGALATLKPFADNLPADASTVGDPRPVLGIALETGALLVEAKKPAEAVPILEKAARLYPQSPAAWEALAQALDAAGRKSDAEIARAKINEITAPPGATGAPANAEISPAMREALTAFSAGKSENALTAVRRELAANPNNLQARSLELRLLLTLQRKDEALKVAQEAVRSNPDNPDLLHQRAAAQMASFNWDAAEQDLRRALQIAPRHTAAMNELAVVLMARGKNDEARTLLEQVLSINPQDQVARASLDTLKGGAAPKKP
jgi:tetratricopeptide (TPR) repeat protein